MRLASLPAMHRPSIRNRMRPISALQGFVFNFWGRSWSVRHQSPHYTIFVQPCATHASRDGLTPKLSDPEAQFWQRGQRKSNFLSLMVACRLEKVASIRLSKQYQNAFPPTIPCLFRKADAFQAKSRALLVSGEKRGSQQLSQALHKLCTRLTTD